jgi:hypothetical protein
MVMNFFKNENREIILAKGKPIPNDSETISP